MQKHSSKWKLYKFSTDMPHKSWKFTRCTLPKLGSSCEWSYRNSFATFRYGIIPLFIWKYKKILLLEFTFSCKLIVGKENNFVSVRCQILWRFCMLCLFSQWISTMLFNLHSVLSRELSDFLHLLGKLCFFGVFDNEQKKPYKMHFTENREIVKKEREPVRLFETYPFLG